MKTFLSFGFYDIREQELILSKAILGHLVETALRGLAQCPGVELSGVLLSQSLEVPGCDVPSCILRNIDRAVAEVERAREMAGPFDPDDPWIMILRPGQGALTPSRIREFHAALKLVEVPMAFSIRPHTYLSHPMWNTVTSERRFQVGNAVHQARSGGSKIGLMYDQCPRLWEEIRHKGPAKGSQHLNELCRYDHALYAVSINSAVNDPGFLSSGQPVPAQMNDREALLMGLPVFEMGRDQVPNVAVLESLVRRTRGSVAYHGRQDVPDTRAGKEL